jgi:hypothetical protein
VLFVNVHNKEITDRYDAHLRYTLYIRMYTPAVYFWKALPYLNHIWGDEWGPKPLETSLNHHRHQVALRNAWHASIEVRNNHCWARMCSRLSLCVAVCLLSRCHLCLVLLGVVPFRFAPLGVLRPKPRWGRAWSLIWYFFVCLPSVWMYSVASRQAWLVGVIWI